MDWKDDQKIQIKKSKKTADEEEYSHEDTHMENPFPEREFHPGDRVTVKGGSGIDSDKTGVVVDHWGLSYKDFEGHYKPIDWDEEVAIKLDNGELITMYTNRIFSTDDPMGKLHLEDV